MTKQPLSWSRRKAARRVVGSDVGMVLSSLPLRLRSFSLLQDDESSGRGRDPSCLDRALPSRVTSRSPMLGFRAGTPLRFASPAAAALLTLLALGREGARAQAVPVPTAPLPRPSP